MNTVNQYYLHDLLSPITGLGDDDQAVNYYREQNIQTDEQYRIIIGSKLVSYYEQRSERQKKKSKVSLSYYLTIDSINFERVFESCLPPFDPPRDARRFFILLWEVLFPNESYVLDNVENYREILDIHEPNKR